MARYIRQGDSHSDRRILSTRSVFNLQPIRSKLDSGGLNETLVQKWAATGKKLRLGTVSLESGRMRFVTETGAVIEADQITPVMYAHVETAATRQLQKDIDAVRDTIETLADDLSKAAPSSKPGIVKRITAEKKLLGPLIEKLRKARNLITQVPLKVRISQELSLHLQ